MWQVQHVKTFASVSWYDFQQQAAAQMCPWSIFSLRLGSFVLAVAWAAFRKRIRNPNHSFFIYLVTGLEWCLGIDGEGGRECVCMSCGDWVEVVIALLQGIQLLGDEGSFILLAGRKSEHLNRCNMWCSEMLPPLIWSSNLITPLVAVVLIKLRGILHIVLQD